MDNLSYKLTVAKKQIFEVSEELQSLNKKREASKLQKILSDIELIQYRMKQSKEQHK